MRVPRSTYRLQVNSEFRLSHILESIDFFHALGVSDLYLSPLLQARPGSTHGYDVTDPAHVNAEIGSDAELESLAVELRAREMGLLLDIVPNHMAASEENQWWRDVLEHGTASEYAQFFDIDWEATPPGKGRVILPVLGHDLGKCLQAGEVRLNVSNGEIAIAYFDRTFPIDPSSYDLVAAMLESLVPEKREELVSIAAAARELPRRTNGKHAPQRRQRAAQLKQRLSNFLRNVSASTPVEQLGARAQPDQLQALLDAQPYALTFWVPGAREINYRRFFDISDLVALRTELTEVFDAVHARTLAWLKDRTITGVRIDHIDGLRDPVAYLQRLTEQGRSTNSADPYVVVEKILVGTETLPCDWLTTGTTGYDFIGPLNGVFVHERGWKRLGEVYRRRTESPDFWTLVYEKKKLVIGNLFPSELQTLVSLACALFPGTGTGDIQAAITELTSCLRVYRTYITEQVIHDSDRTVLKETLARAKDAGAPQGALANLTQVLLDSQRPEERDFVMRWQQFSGPVMAKGMEDTAFYHYHHLISACEVGSDPSTAVVAVDEFHRRMQQRQSEWPATMNASSTHDTKRSQDVRARINVLSEITDDWVAFLDRWLGKRSAFQNQTVGVAVPAANEEFLLYQTILGAWPLGSEDQANFEQRIRDYALKAAREGKRYTSWRKQSKLYEDALVGFVSTILHDDEFVQDVRALEKKTSFYGALNSLSQLVLKLGAPGVPDFYQGTELWALTLVDPDNRRPVDYELRMRLLQDKADVSELMHGWRDGRIKLRLTQRGLDLRSRAPDLFVSGEYQPVQVTGKKSEHVLAFQRVLGEQRVLFIAGRFYSGLCKPENWPDPVVWEKTHLQLDGLAGRRWRNIMNREEHDASVTPELAALLDPLPFGIFELV
jgi:(1->4)-alpha-D-glucan 1-alpha-D-glucosylmutase